MRAKGLAAGAALVVAGCGSTPTTPSALPPTAPTTVPTSRTVPSFGLTPTVLPATAADATANARGACSRFSLFYIRLPGGPLTAPVAQRYLAPVQQFASAAATGNPAQWDQLRRAVESLVAYVGTGAWGAASSQIDLAPVSIVYTDCRSLQ